MNLKTLSKTLLTLYILILLWIVLFKFSYDLQSILLHYQTRTLNLIPFATASRGNVREMIDNFVVFIPFGLLLSSNFKQAKLWQKLAVVFSFSLSLEILQYVFAIGVTDMTDVVTNTLGGLFGLALYKLGKKYINAQKIDRLIVVAGAFLLIVLLLLRVFVFKVMY